MTGIPTLRITEIFHSLQGEARSVGIPTIFVRLTGCPLRCQYCDTAYAFDGGEIIEQNSPKEFFNNPQHDRTKLFLSQIL